jgi:hypothetical protein
MPLAIELELGEFYDQVGNVPWGGVSSGGVSVPM